MELECARMRQELMQVNNEQSLLFDERENAVIVDHFNKSESDACLFAMKIEDSSMQPQLDMGDIVIVDADREPNPDNMVVAYIEAKKQTVLRRYGEAEGCLFQLLASNELWATINVKEHADMIIVGVVVELRRYL